MIQVVDLTKIYSSRDFCHQALTNISLTIEDGDIFAIVGSSGAGKSTFVRCLNLLERPSSGSVIIDDIDMVQASRKTLCNQRARISMIFQSFCLFQQKTVLQNVLFPLTLHKKIDQVDKDFAYQLIARVGLEGYEDRYPSQLSGGQKQRVAIARALISKPAYILCDEATSALDRQTTLSILELLKSLNEDLGVTLVLITHSIEVARAICNKVAVFDKGQIAEVGTVEEVLCHPQSEAARRLIEGEVA